MGLKEWMELAYKYGSPLAYSGIFFFTLYKFGNRVLDNYDKRETSYSSIINTGMTAITAQLQELSKAHGLHLQAYERISRDLKDGFDRMLDANRYQRDEHKVILESIQDGEKTASEARERIVSEVSRGCKAK